MLNNKNLFVALFLMTGLSFALVGCNDGGGRMTGGDMDGSMMGSDGGMLMDAATGQDSGPSCQTITAMSYDNKSDYDEVLTSVVIPAGCTTANGGLAPTGAYMVAYINGDYMQDHTAQIFGSSAVPIVYMGQTIATGVPLSWHGTATIPAQIHKDAGAVDFYRIGVKGASKTNMLDCTPTFTVCQ